MLHPSTNQLRALGYTREEEIKIYDEQVQDIIDHTREYLDSLEFMRTYRVFWKDYSFPTPTLLYKHTYKGRRL